MILAYFREYRVWYITCLSSWGLLLLTFYLEHIPLVYFRTASLFSGTLLILVSVWQFLRFSKKLKLLKNKQIEFLSDLQSPSDIAYNEFLQSIHQNYQKEVSDYQQNQYHLEQLVKVWSHQMKIPLSTLSLMEQTKQMDSQILHTQVLRLENYVDSLLNYLKFSKHDNDFRFERLQCRSLIIDVIKKYRLPCVYKEISVQVEGDCELVSDKKWLIFALSQIIDNAIKYNRHNGKIIICLSEQGISIADTGIGILAEDIPRLFEEGFTGYNGREHQKATGIGLYLTKQILDQLDLNIIVTSKIDHGTEVKINSKLLNEV